MRTVTDAAYAGDIVSRLRNWRGLHLAHGGDLFDEAADEIARLRLTDAEREALFYVRGNLLPDGSREGDIALDAICGLTDRHSASDGR